MSRLTWDAHGERHYETGVRNGVLYPAVSGTYLKGVAWNGLTQVTNSPSGAEATGIYADDIKYLNLMSAEDAAGTIEAYTYPSEFSKCVGKYELAPGAEIGQQERRAFGLSYRTEIGNDINGDDYSYKIHLLYGAKVSPSEENFQTIDDSPDAITFSWEYTTEPRTIDGYKPVAHVILDGKAFKKAGLMNALHAIENVLYGTASLNPRLILPNEIGSLIESAKYLRDSSGDLILDSSGSPIETEVFY